MLAGWWRGINKASKSLLCPVRCFSLCVSYRVVVNIATSDNRALLIQRTDLDAHGVGLFPYIKGDGGTGGPCTI